MESQLTFARFRIFGSKGWTRKSTLLKIFLSQNLPLSPIFKCENLRALILREKFANKRVTQLGGLSSRVKFPSSWLWVELVPAWLKAQKFGPAHLICSIQGPLRCNSESLEYLGPSLIGTFCSHFFREPLLELGRTFTKDVPPTLSSRRVQNFFFFPSFSLSW